MSSASDRVAFEESIEGQDNTVLFQSKKYTQVTDSSSTNGNFTGQIQFDLTTLSSQGQWTDLSEGIIQFPVKLSISNSTAVDTSAPLTGVLAATIKNGFHQFVNSIQIQIGGNTVQNTVNFTNIDTTYKILSTWSQDTLHKYGSTLGISLDDWLATIDGITTVTDSLDNAAVVTTVGGFNINANLKNPGLKSRQLMNNNVALNAAATACLGRNILGTNQTIIGKANVQTGTALTAGSDNFVLYAVGTIRLKDQSDFAAKMPMCKNLKGYVYVNYNSSTHNITCSTANPPVLSGIQNLPGYGLCAPAQLFIGAGGFAVPSAQNATNATVSIFKAEVSGVKSTSLTTAAPIMGNARLLVPYYVANPSIDRALTMKKKFRYNERFVTTFSMLEGGTFSGTLTPGITNPTRLILYPYFTGQGTSSNTTFVANPLISAIDGVPATTSPFAAISNLQVYCGNVPMYQQPQNYDFDNWLDEISLQGSDGGQNKESASGLLNQRQWNQLYRYYTTDLSRRLDSEDGCSKSVQVTCNNPTTCPMTVIAIIWREVEVEMDTASGSVNLTR